MSLEVQNSFDQEYMEPERTNQGQDGNLTNEDLREIDEFAAWYQNILELTRKCVKDEQGQEHVHRKIH